MKTMTIYGPNGEKLEARKKDFFIAVKSEKDVCLVCQCNDPLAMAWYVKYVGPGYYHGVCPYCQTEIGIEKPDRKTFPIPDTCKSCSNHPSNGGSGICHCTLGTPQVKC